MSNGPGQDEVLELKSRARHGSTMRLFHGGAMQAVGFATVQYYEYGLGRDLTNSCCACGDRRCVGFVRLDHLVTRRGFAPPPATAV